MYNNIVVPRQWSRLACVCRAASSLEGQRVPTAAAGGRSDGLSPPPRVRRGPTDLLQALAATVGPDPTAAHYKYHDDPYLIPLSNYRKRAYALSAEAGRKAAGWVRDQHAPLFAAREWDPPGKLKTPHYNAEPHIDAFAPKPIYTDDSVVTEEDLKYTIENALVEDAVKVYQLLGGTEGTSPGLRLQLLQLLCFCNERPPDSGQWLEERWFSTATKERQAATWRLGGLADQIFASLEPKGPEAYCAIIQGMAKFYQAERAAALAAEARAAGIPLSTGVYNALIGCVGFLREGVALRVDALKALLQEMHDQGLTPDGETLSAALRSLSLWGGGRALQTAALQLLAEARALGLRPSLAAYYHLLCLFCKERGPRVDILSGVLDELCARERLVPAEPHDTSFFVTAMGVCSDHLQDMALAERVHALLMRGDHYRLVGDAYKESIYYRHYVTVACRHAPLEQTLALLDALVPNVYVPEPSVMEQIIVTLEAAGAGARLAAAWAQLVVFGLARRPRLLDALLRALRSCYDYQEPEVQAAMRAAAADALRFGPAPAQVQVRAQDAPPHARRARDDPRSPAPLPLSADSLTTIAVLCSDAGEGADGAAGAGWEAAAEAARRLARGQAAGAASDPRALAALAARAAAQGKHGVAANLVQYLAECGYPEAGEAAAAALGAALGRSPADLRPLLAAPPSASAPTAAHRDALSPSALAMLEAYHLAAAGGGGGVGGVRGGSAAGARSYGSGSGSSSDSDLSSSDDE